MQRIKQLSDALVKGEITPKAFRSALVAQLSMMDDETAKNLARWLLQY